jgi:hypothetical protein
MRASTPSRKRARVIYCAFVLAIFVRARATLPFGMFYWEIG